MVLQSNVIEAGPNMQRESEKEWYYGNADKERLGPYSFEEVCLVTVLTLVENIYWYMCFTHFECIRTPLASIPVTFLLRKLFIYYFSNYRLSVLVSLSFISVIDDLFANNFC